MNHPISLLVEELRAGRVTADSVSKTLSLKGPDRRERRASFTRTALQAGLPAPLIALALGHQGGRHE